MNEFYSRETAIIISLIISAFMAFISFRMYRLAFSKGYEQHIKSAKQEIELCNQHDTNIKLIRNELDELKNNLFSDRKFSREKLDKLYDYEKRIALMESNIESIKNGFETTQKSIQGLYGLIDEYFNNGL